MSQIPIDDPRRGTEGPSGAEPAADRPAPESGAGAEPAVEEQLRRLEEIVHRLESEAISLDESIALFEEGVQLAVRVRRRLEATEERIKQIVERSEGLFSLEDFNLE